MAEKNRTEYSMVNTSVAFIAQITACGSAYRD